MKILVVSDTHGNEENFDEVIKREKPFDYLIHLGDVEGSEEYIIAAAECPCEIVRGNNDFYSMFPRESVICISGYRMFITHGHYYDVYYGNETLYSECVKRGCEVAMYGHTHVPVVEEEDGILFINPGSLTFPRQKGRNPSYVVMQIDEENDVKCDIKYLF